MNFCKILFQILWLSLEINVYDVAVWLTADCIFKNIVTCA